MACAAPSAPRGMAWRRTRGAGVAAAEEQKATKTRVGLQDEDPGPASAACCLSLSAAYIVFTYIRPARPHRVRDAGEVARAGGPRWPRSGSSFPSISDTINHTSDGVYDYKSLHCAIAGKSVAALFSRNSDYSDPLHQPEPAQLLQRARRLRGGRRCAPSRPNPSRDRALRLRQGGRAVGVPLRVGHEGLRELHRVPWRAERRDRRDGLSQGGMGGRRHRRAR